VQRDCNLTDAQVNALEFATQAGGQFLATALAAEGKVCWDCLSGRYQLAPPDAGNCAPTMRALCQPGTQGQTMFMAWNGANTTLAAFLVTRPPIAFIGERLSDDNWSPLFALDVGAPEGLCAEGPAGVFTRSWSKGLAALDCNTFTASLPFDTLPGIAGRTSDPNPGTRPSGPRIGRHTCTS
jgi:hypothetical protein